MVICRELEILRSQFFQRRRHFSNHPNVRSTTHRLGITAKVCNSLRLATSTAAPITASTASANFSPVYPPSTKAFIVLVKLDLHSSNISNAPFRSVTFAVVTCIACGNPLVSTPICIFIPEVFFRRRSLFLQPSQCF